MNQLLSRHERVSIRQWRLVKVGSALCSQLCSSCVIPSTVHPSCRCFIFLSFSPRRDSLSSKSKYSRNSRNDTPSTLVKRGCTYLIPSQRLAIIFPQFLPTLIQDIHAHRKKKGEGERIATTTGLHHTRETFARPCQPISCIKPPGYSKYGATKSTNCSSKVWLLLLKGAQLGPGPSDSDMLFWSSACWFYCTYKSSRIISDR